MPRPDPTPAQGPDAPPDVFLSYAREDAAHAEWAFRVLSSRGWSVWFDREMVGGERWRTEIDEVLDDVGCVVVFWSAASIASHWVLDEAGEGMERGVLVPALLEDVAIPIGFREVQAIDLVRARVTSERAEEALVKAVATVLGRPALEGRKPSRAFRLLRASSLAGVAALPGIVALPLLLRPAPRAVIDLDVTASEVGFLSAREQDLTDLLVVSGLEADGLAAADIPRTRATDARALRPSDGRGMGLRLSSGEPSGAGSITLEGIGVTQGTRVSLASPGPGRLRVSLRGSTRPITASVDGVLRMTLSTGATETPDFGTPKPLTIEPDPRGADLSLDGLDAAGRLVSAPLRLEELTLTRIDETLETTRSQLAVVSTIRSGAIRFDPPHGPEHEIGAGERLRFGTAAGEISELTLVDGGLRLRFSGAVDDVASCDSHDDCRSWMPSTLESLVARGPSRVLLLVGAFLLYLLGVVRIVRGRLTASLRLLTLALAWALSAPASSAGQEGPPARDRDEVVKRLVVRIDSGLGFGSGIIVGSRSDTLFVATANHVVRRGPSGADSIDVRFYWGPDVPTRAILLGEADDSLDLAVLAVTPLSALPPDAALATSGGHRPLDPRTIRLDRMGDLARLERGDAIYLLGQPNGLPWRVNMTPERFIGFRGASMDFESNLLARGHSGGALLNDDREVVGMLKSDQPPYGEAVSIYAIARRLEAWGYPVDLRLRAPQIAAGDGRTCVLGPRGETRCRGFDSRYETGALELDMRLKQISIGGSHLCGIAAGGRAFCLGNNHNAQLGDGTTTSRYDAPVEVAGGLAFEAISAGAGHTCGVAVGGDVYCWGLAEGGQLGSGFEDDRTTPFRVPTTERFRSVSVMWQYSCGLTIAGAAYCWGQVAASTRPRSPVGRFAPGLAFVSLTAGYDHICGVVAHGAAFCWGFNDDGQLGTGSRDEGYHEDPGAVAGGHAFVSLSAGMGHTCGVTYDGQAWCWGSNHFGQLGDGSTEDSPVPVRVGGGLVFESIDAGNLHTCGFTTDDTLWCWGDNQDPVAPGGNAIRPDGEEMYLEPVRVLGFPENERRPWR